MLRFCPNRIVFGFVRSGEAGVHIVGDIDYGAEGALYRTSSGRNLTTSFRLNASLDSAPNSYFQKRWGASLRCLAIE